MNIVLVGYRCSGKTCVGERLARHLKRIFVDTDRLIEEKTGIDIPSYVSQKGWKAFRRAEREVVREVSTRDNRVIATGGGVVVDEENVKELRKTGWVVWLAAGAPFIRERMKHAQQQGDMRPALSGDDPLEEIETILQKRAPIYEKASDFKVDTDGRPPKEVEWAILKALPPGLEEPMREGF